MKTAALLVLLLVAASPSAAQPIFVAWDDADGPSERRIPCNTNLAAGNQYFVTRFVSPADLPQFVGLTVVIDVLVRDASSLPDWWRMGSGECRDGGYRVETATGLGLTQRPDPFQDGNTFTGFMWQSGVPYPNQAHITSDVVRDTPFPLTSGAEYYAAAHVLRAIKTVGNGSCTGCLNTACFGVRRIELFQRAGSPGGDVVIIEASTQQWPPPIVSWQGEPFEACGLVDATRRSTWGGLKSLYR